MGKFEVKELLSFYKDLKKKCHFIQENLFKGLYKVDA